MMVARAYIESIMQVPLSKAIAEGLRYIKFGDHVKTNNHIFIKPNLTYPIYSPGVMTSLETIKALIEAVRDYTSNIYMGDADSGGYNRFSMDKVYQATGMTEIAKQYSVNIVNLSQCARKPISIFCGGRQRTIEMPALLIDNIDYLLTLPVPKIHNMTGVSLSMKNQWGCIPEPSARLMLHPFFDEAILEINKAVKTTFVCMDGKWGLNENGPMRGRPVELNWILMANNMGAAEQIACELMQIPLNRIEHLRHANNAGFIPSRDEIIVNQSIAPFIGESFKLHRVLSDYIGLAAFNSSFIAWLAYFSPLASLLHKILNHFREPFYDYKKYSTKTLK
jgi:uncharacterized protein (DUF362 family)